MQVLFPRSGATRLAALVTLVALSAASLSLAPHAVHAQNSGDSSLRSAPAPRVYPVKPDGVPRPSAHAVRATGPIQVDGRLDEPSWQAAQPLGDFVQQLPQTGHAATFPTVVRVMYDDENVYVGATLRDPEPSKAITAGLERDFDSGNSDIFGVVFDTFLDRRNSFLFLVNPRGAVRDEQTWNDSRNIVEAWRASSSSGRRSATPRGRWRCAFPRAPCASMRRAIRRRGG